MLKILRIVVIVTLSRGSSPKRIGTLRNKTVSLLPAAASVRFGMNKQTWDRQRERLLNETKLIWGKV